VPSSEGRIIHYLEDDISWNSCKTHTRIPGIMLQVDEQTLFARLKKNDPDAFRLLFTQYYRGLYSFCGRYISDNEACKDIIQDVFAYIWENRKNISIHTSLKSYLFGSVYHACLDHIKKTRRIQDFSNTVTGKFIINPLEESFSENGYHRIFFEESKAIIDSAIEALPEACKAIFKMSRFQGLKHKAIAELLSISPRTVETQVFRALQLIKEKLSSNN
jgi:RNA polymerase sigma-70 factor, ECF subfamily